MEALAPIGHSVYLVLTNVSPFVGATGQDCWPCIGIVTRYGESYHLCEGFDVEDSL